MLDRGDRGVRCCLWGGHHAYLLMMLVVGDPGCCLFGSGRSQGIVDLVDGDCFGGTHGSDQLYLIWLRILVVFIVLAPMVVVKDMTRYT